MDFRLERSPYNDLLAALGNPQDQLPPTIHIAGTNGKGSTLSFIRSIYESAGYKVHTYTSPHLVRFNERITLGGQHISDDDLAYYLDMTAAANGDEAVTFFEFTTAMAFRAMADHPADLCLLETGLGGRLDCTNIIKHPVATVITQIGEDHTDFLGNSLDKIAWEKAGIMKVGAPCIISRQPSFDIVQNVFNDKAAETGCPLWAEGRDWSVTDLSIGKLGLQGDHQRDNAATAVMTTQILRDRFPVSDGDIENGLANAQWPARMEQITQGQTASLLPDQWELWFDCGHNPSGALVIAGQINRWKQAVPDRPVYLVLGLGDDKDAVGFMSSLWDKIDGLTCIDLPNARKPRTAKDLAAILPDGPHQAVSTIHQAVGHIISKNKLPAIILVTGSLYLYDQIIS